MSTDVADIVDKGFRRLNQFFAGPDWTSRISTGELDMETTHRCILGQLFGSYDTGVEALNLNDDEEFAIDYGYCPLEGTDTGNRVLTEEWKRRIQEVRQPQPGDKVQVTFNATWREDGDSQTWLFAPRSMVRAVVVNPRPRPEPGDRVQHSLSRLLGTVLKPHPDLDTNGHSARVHWDVSCAPSTVEARHLEVV